MKSTKSVRKSKSQPIQSKPAEVCPPDKLTDEEACLISDILRREVNHCKFYRVTGPLHAPKAEVEWYEAHGQWIETVYNKLVHIINSHLLTPAKWYVDQQAKLHKPQNLTRPKKNGI